MFINKLLGLMQELIIDVDFRTRNVVKSTFFSRSSMKLHFDDMIKMILRLPKLSFQLEINCFLEKYMTKVESIAKQSVFEAREKLKPSAFIELNDLFVTNYYAEEYETFEKFRVIAVDGSIFEIPENKYFGGQATISARKPLAQVCSLYDTLNDVVLGAVIEPFTSDEREQASRLIKSLKSKTKCCDLFLFDRGFPSRDLIEELNDTSNFLFRVNTAFLKEINLATDEDQTVQIKVKSGKLIKIRVVNVLLDTGVVEKLFTNIFDEKFTPETFKELYNKRWGIECKYREFKSILQIENFSSAKKMLIEQDFFASIVVANLVSAAKNESDQIINQNDSGKKLKSHYKTNTNLAISELRTFFIAALCEFDPIKRAILTNSVLNKIARYKTQIGRIRKPVDRKKKHPSTKYPLNRKRGL